MTFRLSDRSSLQGAFQQMYALERYVRTTGLEKPLLELVKIRASQINGCAFCLAMHVRDARKAGEREDRIAVLPAWRETGWFSDRERAALAWAEAVTTLENQHVPEDIFQQARSQFGERELSDLTLAIIAINGWNRLNIALTQSEPTPFSFDADSDAEAAD